MSFALPFIGPIVSGIGSLFGGSGTKQEKSAITGGEQQLQDLFGITTPMGKTMSTAGQGTLQSALQTVQQPKDYWSSILSGSRPAQMAAVAPEISNINDIAAASRAKEGAYGTARGGGTAGANVEAETQRQAAIDRALFAARPEAAKGVLEAGRVQGQMGVEQLSAGLRALGLSEDAIGRIMSTATANREQAYKENLAKQRNIGNIIGGGLNILGNLPSGGTPNPPQDMQATQAQQSAILNPPQVPMPEDYNPMSSFGI